MDFRFKSLLFVYLFCSAVLMSVCFVPEAFAAAEESATAAEVPAFPYIAQMTGDDVYIRSGPGTQYYRCGKLNKTDRVKVVGRQFSWSRIVPPAGSFSWISTQYVSVGAKNSSVGAVTGDAVRVYAGSPHLKPIHSTTMQLKLNSDDKVRLPGEESGGYWQIAPPTGAYLWVSTEYTKALGPAGEVKLDVEPEPEAAAAETAAVVPTVISDESTKLNRYYALEKQLAVERNKAMANQDYTELKKAFGELAIDKAAGKAGRYAEFALGQIKRYELALAVGKETRLQDQNLRQIKGRIDKARVKRVAEIPRLDKFAAVGRFETSNIYVPKAKQKYYRIMDDSGRTVCYAVATSVAMRMDLRKFIGKKVGLIGEIKPHPETGGALVRFWRVWPVE